MGQHKGIRGKEKKDKKDNHLTTQSGFEIRGGGCP